MRKANMSYEIPDDKLRKARGGNCFFQLPEKALPASNCGVVKQILAVEILLAQGHYGMFRLVHGAVAQMALTPKPPVSFRSLIACTL
jgi:hypothetical protein